jgi:hypothetical protein
MDLHGAYPEFWNGSSPVTTGGIIPQICRVVLESLSRSRHPATPVSLFKNAGDRVLPAGHRDREIGPGWRRFRNRGVLRFDLGGMSGLAT